MKEYSKIKEINEGYYHGLQKDIHEVTGISKPVIHKAITDGDNSSPLKLKAIQTAINLITDRKSAGTEQRQLAYAQYQSEVLEFREPDGTYTSLNAGEEYTYLDYLKWKFLDRVELIRGKIVKMSPAPGSSHQRALRDIYYYFDQHFRGKVCELFYAPLDVRLPVPSEKHENTVVQPDLLVVCDSTKIDRKGCNGAPDMVLEIVSPGRSRHDLKVKFGLYEESGVKEYWIVQPAERCILIFYLQDGKYIGLPPFTEGDMAKGVLFEDLEVPVTEVFKAIPSIDY
jgi:Uma2 family endonuclease